MDTNYQQEIEQLMKTGKKDERTQTQTNCKENVKEVQEKLELA